MNTDNITTRRQAIAAVRAEADAVIEQLERRAKGWDRGAWRDDMRDVECNFSNTIARTLRESSRFAFALSAKFANVETIEAAAPVADEPAGVLALDITRPGDTEPTRWYFDLSAQWHLATTRALACGAYVVQVPQPVTLPGDDFITSADECFAWLRREG